MLASSSACCVLVVLLVLPTASLGLQGTGKMFFNNNTWTTPVVNTTTLPYIGLVFGTLGLGLYSILAQNQATVARVWERRADWFSPETEATTAALVNIVKR